MVEFELNVEMGAVVGPSGDRGRKGATRRAVEEGASTIITSNSTPPVGRATNYGLITTLKGAYSVNQLQ